jgi:glycerophosphoryl diester phosphodiesterase
MVNVVAHRGASAANPPGNTIAAFAEAVKQGADWVELDVHLTADGEVVVHHDPVLADGRVLGELSAADLPDHIPTLAKALVACSPLAVNVEIKPDGVDALRPSLIAKVVELLQSEPTSREFLVTSFDHDICDQVRALDATVPTGLLNAHGNSLQTDLDRAGSAGHVAINPWYGLVTKEFVDRAHALGVVVNVWTVDDPEQMRALDEMGVDAIITNVPSLCREVLSAR